MSIALITSIYGDYDELVDPPEQEDVTDYVAVVDRYHEGCQLWRQTIEPRPHMHPRMAAKVAKCRPDLYSDVPVAVWVDGGAQLLHHQAAQWAAGHVSFNEPLAQFRHPQRDDSTSEAEVSAGMEKYANQPVLEQAAYYKKCGLPDHWGLWATGIIASHWRVWDLLGDAWLTEQLRWSYQDQVSEPFVLWHLDRQPVTLPGDLWRNPHVRFGGHRSTA